MWPGCSSHSHHRPPRAASSFGATSLPAIAYTKPHCLPATCGTPPVLELVPAHAAAPHGNMTRLSGAAPTSATAVAAWIKRSAS